MSPYFIIAMYLVLVIDQTIGQAWDYHALGPDVWGDSFPLCRSRSQSPININPACTQYEPIAPFQFTPAYSTAQNLTLFNNGRTILGTSTGNGATPLLLTGGGLNGTYQFYNLHLHWGENYRTGSEHQVNGQKYAGEIHFVHYQPSTGKFAVLGMFMESVPNGTTSEAAARYPTARATTAEWLRYTSTSQRLRSVNDTVTINLNFTALMGTYVTDFWRYDGSFTTPPCSEGVSWTLFRAPIIFTESDLSDFRRNVYFEVYRGPQPLYDRVVYRNYRDEIVSTIPDFACCGKSANAGNYATERLAKLDLPWFILIFLYVALQFSVYPSID